MVTFEQFKDFIDKMPEQQIRRDHIIYTGIEGRARINLQVKKENLTRHANDLLHVGKISLEQYKRVTQMINSPGDDNLIIVESILNFRENNVK